MTFKMTHNKFCINMSAFYTEFKLINSTMRTTTHKKKKKTIMKRPSFKQ